MDRQHPQKAFCMTSDSISSPWPRRLGLTGIVAAALAALGAYGSGWGLWHFTIGFAMIGAALILAMVAAIGGLFALSRRRSSKLMLAGMATATILIGLLGTIIYRGSQVPPIHDVTTNLNTEIVFGDLPGRPDRFTGLEGGMAEWQRLHRAAYGDIQPVRLSGRRETLMPRIAEIVRARGWDVAYADDQRIEATETVSPFRFKDDIIIVATPENTGATTRIDIRSVSRVGISDLGVNARRVRALTADIRALED
jgi:uncharacterized protein (DUF1499 family)